MKNKRMLAVDIGAGSGRIFCAEFNGEKLTMEESLRFSHRPATIRKDIYWDFLAIWNAVYEGISRTADRKGNIDTIGIDSFAPDFGMFDARGYLLGNLLSYQTVLSEDLSDEILAGKNPWELFQYSGLQCTNILLLPQLLFLKRTGREWMLAKGKVLPMVNALNYLLTGIRQMDFTVASISMLWDSKKKGLSQNLINRYLNAVDCFEELAENQSVVGKILPELAGEHLKETQIVNCGVHDTTVAMYALDSVAGGQICMNCGTWTAIGVVVDEPVINREAFSLGLTNYGLPDGRYMFGTVLLGLFYLQKCKEEWELQGDPISFEKMTELGSAAQKFHVDLNHPILQDSSRPVTNRIDQYFFEKGLKGPAAKGEYIRCIIESLTDEYRRIVEALETASGIQYSGICMGGGGIKNSLLVKLLQRKTGKKVNCMTAEVTVLGNLLSQLAAAGEIKRGELKDFVSRALSMEHR